MQVATIGVDLAKHVFSCTPSDQTAALPVARNCDVDR